MQLNTPPTEGGALDTALRVSWLAIGPGIAAVLLTSIVSNGGWFTGANLSFAVVIVATIALRWYEWSRGNALTAEGEPATHGILVRYTLGLSVIAVAAWVGANLLAGSRIFSGSSAPQALFGATTWII